MIEIMDDLQATAGIRNAYVVPFYLRLLGGNFTCSNNVDDDIPQQIVRAARGISDQEIDSLLGIPEWRGRLTAAWYVGLTKRTSFVHQIADLLLASEMVYAGQGYCIALGLIGGEICAAHLRAYLNKYLPIEERFYDQTWAVGALANIEGAAPAEFLDPPLWTSGTQALDPWQGITRHKKIAAFIGQQNMITPLEPK